MNQCVYYFKPPWRSCLDYNKQLIEHYERINSDIRGEMKKRIAQRDSYSIQLIISLGTLFAVSISQESFDKVLLVAPLVAIYFTNLILYSYKVHSKLANYLKNVIYPKFKEILPGIDEDIEWENYYISKQKPGISKNKPGIRKGFFIFSMILVNILSGIYMAFKYLNDSFIMIVYVLYFVYTIALIIVIGNFFFRNVDADDDQEEDEN
jgi:hypothetical protein